MANAYKAAAKRLQRDDNKPFNRRHYDLILLNPEKAEFDEDHATVKAVTEEDGNDPIDRIALRTQQISDPKSTLGDAQLLQFFAVNPNRRTLLRGSGRENSGVIVEVDGSKEIPLYFLNVDEVFELVRGAGYNAPILSPAVPAA